MRRLPEIKLATLLSVEEAQTLLTQEERVYDYWWWLRSPGYNQYDATHVNLDGSVSYYGYSVDYGDDCVRPALKISLKYSDYRIGDIFKFGNKIFKILSDDLAFCLEDIGTHCFRKDWQAPDANIYEVSDVKKFIDAWFEQAKNKEKNDSDLDYINTALTDAEKDAYLRGWKDGYREAQMDIRTES